MHPAWRRRHFPDSPIALLGLGAASDYGQAGSELTREECLKVVALAFHMYHKAKGYPVSLERAYDIKGAEELALVR
eukprot:6140143-Pyramimonas_sp.AAC.1